MNYKSLLICLGFILFTSATISLKTTTAFAQSNEITYEKVNPDQTLRFQLKRFIEKVNIIKLTFFSTDKKASYYLSLVEKRGKELIYIGNNQKLDLLETTSSRYITYVGLLNEELESSKTNIDKQKALTIFSEQIQLFQESRDKYPANSSQWILLQQAIDTAKVIQSQIISS